MPEAATALGWTCDRCEVTVSWMPDVKRPEMPPSWVDVDGVLHCLSCRREVAADAGVDDMPEDTPASERQKLRSHARIEFEVQRDPERPDNRIAKSCHTSIIAVRKARIRLGIPPGP